MSKTKIEVMVLDDEAIVGERLKDFLEGKGISVETFTDSGKAIKRISEKEFDVVITDYKMEGHTGIDVLKFIKDNRPATQVIIITAYAMLERLRESEALGAYKFVTKPFQMADIHKLVRGAAGKKVK